MRTPSGREKKLSMGKAGPHMSKHFAKCLTEHAIVGPRHWALWRD